MSQSDFQYFSFRNQVRKFVFYSWTFILDTTLWKVQNKSTDYSISQLFDKIDVVHASIQKLAVFDSKAGWPGKQCKMTCDVTFITKKRRARHLNKYTDTLFVYRVLRFSFIWSSFWQASSLFINRRQESCGIFKWTCEEKVVQRTSNWLHEGCQYFHINDLWKGNGITPNSNIMCQITKGNLLCGT